MCQRYQRTNEEKRTRYYAIDKQKTKQKRLFRIVVYVIDIGKASSEKHSKNDIINTAYVTHGKQMFMFMHLYVKTIPIQRQSFQCS